MSYLTTYFELKTVLVTLLRADPAFTGVVISYGQTLTDRDTGFKTIYFGTASGTREVNTLRPTRPSLKETYDFDLHIECWLEGVSSQEEADAVCSALADRVAVILGDNRDLQTHLIDDIQAPRWDHTGGAWDRGYASGLRLGITVKARLT